MGEYHVYIIIYVMAFNEAYKNPNGTEQDHSGNEWDCNGNITQFNRRFKRITLQYLMGLLWDLDLLEEPD